MQPNNYSQVPFAAGRTCFVLPDVLDEVSCSALVERATTAGFAVTSADYPPSYRDNDRWVTDDFALARDLFARLSALMPERWTDEHGNVWRLVGLNERFRFCRYTGGQQFRIHRDGSHARGQTERSFLTLQIYLDDGHRFEGGRTRFYGGRHGPLVGAVVPRSGMAIVFDNDLWHDGEPVSRGTKHVLRTDVMYAREHASAPGDRRVLFGHFGYVWKVVSLRDGGLASASRDRTIRVWHPDAGGFGCVAVLRGHDGSVHALCEGGPGELFSGSRDHEVRLWDVSAGTSRVVARHAGAVLCLQRLRGDLLASGSGDGLIRLLDLRGEPRGDLRGHSGWVWALASIDDDLVASGSEDGTIRLWNLVAGACLDAAAPGRGPVHALARIDETTLLAGFADGHVIIYFIDRHKEKLASVQVIAAHRGEVYDVRSLHGGRLVTAGEDDAARVYRIHDGALLTEIPHHGFVRSVAVLEDGKIASAGYEGVLRLSQP
jgi:WD40 repeat protein